jgi:hypothetical protein
LFRRRRGGWHGTETLGRALNAVNVLYFLPLKILQHDSVDLAAQASEKPAGIERDH